MRSDLYHFIWWLSHTSTSAIPSQNYISYSQMNHNHTNQNPGPFDLYLCHGKLWQSPKVTEGMATAVGSCWWLLLPVPTCDIEGHAGDMHVPLWHVLLGMFSPQTPLSLRRQHMGQTQPWIRTFPSLLHKYYAIYLVVFPSTSSQLTSHSPCSFPLLTYGMEWITHFLMKTRMLKSCLKEEDYSDHWDNSFTVDSQNKAVGRQKKPNI